MNGYKTPGALFIFGLTLFLPLITSGGQGQPFLRVDVTDYPDYSRVILEFSTPMSSSVEKSGSLLLVKIRSSDNIRLQRSAFRSRIIDSLSWARGSDYFMLSIQARFSEFSFDSFKVQSPPQLVIDVSPTGSWNVTPPPKEKPRAGSEISRPADKDRMRLPSTGMRTVVIDPGHGGLQSGTKGKQGTLEKDLTLQISLNLKRIIEHNLAYHVELTRDKDVDVSLESRAAKANNTEAALFISIHVNGSRRKDAKGSATYFLSMEASDEESRRLAYLENNSEDYEEALQGSGGDEIKMILWDMAQAAFLNQSSQLAESIQRELNALLGTRNRGIKQAPFKVLTGAACPAVLVEVAFLTNPEEEKLLKTPDFQERIAQAIYRGMANFLNAYNKD